MTIKISQEFSMDKPREMTLASLAKFIETAHVAGVPLTAIPTVTTTCDGNIWRIAVEG